MKSPGPKNGFFKTAATLGLIVLASGCGLTKAQKEGISSFGQASATLGTASKEQFQTGREAVIQMKKQRLAIEKKMLPDKKTDGTPADRTFYAEVLNLDSGLDQENVEKRIRATELLTQYGKLLVAFSEKTLEKELSASADKFMNSVKAFPDTLTPDQIQGLGKIVEIAGNFWVEKEKKDALQQIVPTMSPLIDKICDALAVDFDLKKMGIAANIYNVQDRLANEAIAGLKRDGGSLSDRLLLIDGFYLADQNKATLQNTSKGILKSVSSLRQANDKLARQIASDKLAFEDVKAFADDAKNVANAVKPFTR